MFFIKAQLWWRWSSRVRTKILGRGSLPHKAVHEQTDAPSGQDIPCWASDLATCSPWWHSTAGVGTVVARSSIHSGAGWTWRWCEGGQTACVPSASPWWPGVGQSISRWPWCCSSADPGPRCFLSPCTGSWALISICAPAHLVISESSRTRLTSGSASLWHNWVTLNKENSSHAASSWSSCWGHLQHGYFQWWWPSGCTDEHRQCRQT